MLKSTKSQRGDVLVVKLSGVLNEECDLQEIIGESQGELHVHCKGLVDINSEGVKLWIQFFQKQRSAGKIFKFIECSPSTVARFNEISNFGCDGPIESIYLPYACKNCKKRFVSLMSAQDLRKVYKSLPTPKCTQCGNVTFFDDIEDEFFAFLKR